jgi:FHS family L-fucose permease-like MFS transporter
MKHDYKPLLLLSAMFLLVGSMFCMNDILLPSLISHFGLSYTQATFIQLSFYLTYIVFPVPIAWLIYKYDYKICLLIALASCFLGCILFVPAKIFDSYIIVLIALFIISTGITVINVAANPFVTLLGDPEGAHIRMNFVQVFSRVGYAATPFYGTILIYKSNGQISFDSPYIALAAGIFIIGLLIFFSKMPKMKPDVQEKFSLISIFGQWRKYKHLFFGIFAMFFYVGAEACTAGFFIPYLKSVLGFTAARAANYLTIYYILAALMGFMAVFILRYIKAHILVGLFGLGMIAIFLVCILLNTGANELFLAALGFFLSIMFPTLFSLAIEDIGSFVSKGSALLNIAIVGGAVFPPIQGMIADNFGVKVSYVVPLFCFMMITIYAFLFTKEPIMKRIRLMNNKK